MTDYGYTPVIRLPKSKVDRYPEQVNQSIISETLFLKSFPSTVSEKDLRLLLKQYQPLEIQLYRHSGEGYIRFRDASTADQVYALYQSSQFSNGTKLHLSIDQEGRYEPEGTLLKVAHLPRYVENTMIYDLFRRYGTLALCKLLLEQDDSGYYGTALIQYFYRGESESAIQEMHGQMVDGNKIVVEPFISNDLYQKLPSTPSMNTDKHSDSNYVDVTNLYVKNLDPKINNSELFNAFRPFGRIVSARVMTNPANNQSKGYGFVSYSRSDEARTALEQMNGKLFYQKPLLVSFHAPKKPRQPTAAAADAAAATQVSPPQEYSPSYHDSRQQQHQTHRADISTPNSTVSSTLFNGLGIDNVDQLSMDIKDFSIGHQNSSIPTYPIQRKPSGTDNYMSMQQVRMSSPFSSSPISGSTGHSLASLASGLSIQQAPPPPLPSVAHHQQPTQHTTATSVGGSLSHITSHQLLSGGGQHTMNGRSTKDYKQTAEGRPSLRRKSSLESISTVMTESSANLQRQKLTQAVLQCDVPFDNPSLVSEIVDMLLTLKKKERSLCLFNQDFLKAKIQLALEALETFHDGDNTDEEEEEDKLLQKMLPRQAGKKKSLPSSSNQISPSAPVTTAAVSPTPNFGMISQQPATTYHHTDIPKSLPTRVSKAIPIVAPPPDDDSKKATTKTKVLSKADETVIDTLMKSMEGKAIHEKKQLLGDRLFPLVKATGTKQAPKVTIALLDSIDLLELATMMFDKDALKKQSELAFTALKQQQH